MLLKKGQNGSVMLLLKERRLLLFICWFVITSMVLIHQVHGNDGQAGFGRHEKTGTTVKLSETTTWKVAATNADLESYIKATGLNPCSDIQLDDTTKDITIKYSKSGKARANGCMVDLLVAGTKASSFEFKIGIFNGNGLDKCLYQSEKKKICNHFLGFETSCEHYHENLYRSHYNTMPFIYSRTVKDFQNLRQGNLEPADGCPSTCNGHKVCSKWTGIAAGFINHEGRVMRTLMGIGDPGGAYCSLAAPASSNDASYSISIETGAGDWFTTKDCVGADGGNYPGKTICVNKANIAKGLGDTLVWKIDNAATINHGGNDHLLTFYLLPQGSTKPHIHNDREIGVGGIGGDQLRGPDCDEIFVKFEGSDYKVLVPEGSGPVVQVTLPPMTIPETSEGETTEKINFPEGEGGGGGIVIIIIVVVVLILVPVVGILVWLFVFRKSEPDAVEEDYFGTTKGGATAKTKATTVGATQAKTGGMTTTKAGTTAKTAAAATKAGTTAGTKGGTTAGGGKTAGGGTTKK